MHLHPYLKRFPFVRFRILCLQLSALYCVYIVRHPHSTAARSLYVAAPSLHWKRNSTRYNAILAPFLFSWPSIDPRNKGPRGVKSAKDVPFVAQKCTFARGWSSGARTCSKPLSPSQITLGVALIEARGGPSPPENISDAPFPPPAFFTTLSRHTYTHAARGHLPSCGPRALQTGNSRFSLFVSRPFRRVESIAGSTVRVLSSNFMVLLLLPTVPWRCLNVTIIGDTRRCIANDR